MDNTARPRLSLGGRSAQATTGTLATTSRTTTRPDPAHGHSHDVVQHLGLDDEEAARLAAFERNFSSPIRRSR